MNIENYYKIIELCVYVFILHLYSFVLIDFFILVYLLVYLNIEICQLCQVLRKDTSLDGCSLFEFSIVGFPSKCFALF